MTKQNTRLTPISVPETFNRAAYENIRWDHNRPITIERVRNKDAFATIHNTDIQFTADPAPAPATAAVVRPLITASTIRPITSSATAAPKMMRASLV